MILLMPDYDKYEWQVASWERCLVDEREQMKARNYSFHLVSIYYI